MTLALASFIVFVSFESKVTQIEYARIIPINHIQTNDIIIDVFISYTMFYLDNT